MVLAKDLGNVIRCLQRPGCDLAHTGMATPAGFQVGTDIRKRFKNIEEFWCAGAAELFIETGADLANIVAGCSHFGPRRK